MAENAEISYDFHGDSPFSTPFSELSPSEIHVYVDLDTTVGRDTCGQKCSHCWFVNYDKVYNKAFDMAEGRELVDSLTDQGFNIFPRYVDSFAYNGAFVELYGSQHNREFRQGDEHDPTETMVAGDAWTSGRPLLDDNWIELLDLAWTNGFRTVSMTYHGLIGEDLKVRSMREYPIKGVFPGADLERVVARIADYNATRGLTGPDRFRINIGLTLGTHNSSRDALVRYAHYFNALGVATVRFNSFFDHGKRHPDLEMSDAEVARTYADLKWLHETVDLDFQLGVSEDFGTTGISVLELPPHVGWCRAGRQLFAAIPTTPTEISGTSSTLREQVGDLVGCVNIFEPTLGAVVRETDRLTGAQTYVIDFDVPAIEEFTGKRMKGEYKNGCFARELADELDLTARVPGRKQLPLEVIQA